MINIVKVRISLTSVLICVIDPRKSTDQVDDSGKFSHSGAPPNIGTYYTSGIFIHPDSLSIKSSGWVDEQYYNEIIWVGRKSAGISTSAGVAKAGRLWI